MPFCSGWPGPWGEGYTVPPLCLHLSLARDALFQLGDSPGGGRGRYLIGATLPDIHMMSDFAREHTHYMDLAQREEGGEEIARFFRANPHLAHESKHPPTRALVAGYLSHLVTDSAWIARIYRPYFGPESSLSGDPLANLLDRLLQFELDRRVQEDMAGMAALVKDIGLVSWDEEAALFDEDSLTRWQTFVMDAAVRPHTWDRFPTFVRHYVARHGNLREDQVKRFLSDIPARLSWVLEHVPPEALVAFRQGALQGSLRLARERGW